MARPLVVLATVLGACASTGGMSIGSGHALSYHYLAPGPDSPERRAASAALVAGEVAVEQGGEARTYDIERVGDHVIGHSSGVFLLEPGRYEVRAWEDHKGGMLEYYPLHVELRAGRVYGRCPAWRATEEGKLVPARALCKDITDDMAGAGVLAHLKTAEVHEFVRPAKGEEGLGPAAPR